MISYMISTLPSSSDHAVALACADIYHDSYSVQIMDSDEERDFADQGHPSDFESEEDTHILATLLKQIPACINAADIELLLTLSYCCPNNPNQVESFNIKTDHASLAATSTSLFHIPSRTISFLELPQLTLLRLKGSEASESAIAGSGQLRQGSCAVNRPGLGLLAAAQNEQTVCDIMYDINACSCMISCPTQLL